MNRIRAAQQEGRKNIFKKFYAFQSRSYSFWAAITGYLVVRSLLARVLVPLLLLLDPQPTFLIDLRMLLLQGQAVREWDLILTGLVAGWACITLGLLVAGISSENVLSGLHGSLLFADALATPLLVYLVGVLLKNSSSPTLFMLKNLLTSLALAALLLMAITFQKFYFLNSFKHLKSNLLSRKLCWHNEANCCIEYVSSVVMGVRSFQGLYDWERIAYFGLLLVLALHKLSKPREM